MALRSPRRFDRRRFVQGAAAGAGMLTLPATALRGRRAGAAPLRQTPAGNQTLIYAEIAEVRSIDPANALESQSFHVTRAAYEGLAAHVEGTGDVEPRLAASWTISDDATTYTFTLQPNVKFHDGTTMDATAVKKSYDRVLAMNLGPASLLSNVAEVKVVDAGTVQIILKQPHAFFMAYVPKIGIVSPAAWESNDKGGDYGAAWLEENTAGTGPYRVTKISKSEQIVLEQFADYWRGWEGTHLSKIALPVVPEPATRRQMLEAGEAHLVGLMPPDDIAQLQTTPGIKVVVSDHYEIDIITLNTTKPPLDDVRVRKAMQLAFDYQGYLDKVLLGNGNIPSGPIARGYPSFDESLPPFKQDLEQAKALLTEAGVESATLTKNFVDQIVGEQQSALILQDALKELGITLEVNNLPWSTMFAIAGNPDEAMHMSNLLMAAFTADPTFTLNQNYGCAFAGKPYNWSWYCNQQAQALIDQAGVTLDPEASYDLLRQAQRLIIDDAPAIFYANPKAVEPMSDKVQGYTWNPVDYYWQVDWYDVWLSE